MNPRTQGRNRTKSKNDAKSIKTNVSKHAKKNESLQQQKYKQFNEVQAVEGVLKKDLNTAQENQLKKMKRLMPQKVP